MKKIKTFIFLTLFILIGKTSIAQENATKSTWISKHPIEFSMGSHAISLPFKQFLSSPFYPELNIGIQFNVLDKKKINLNVVNGIGFASHKFNGDRYFVDTFLRFKYKLPFNIYSQVGVGLALNLLTYPNEVYKLNNNGVYETANSVETELYGGFNIEIGYHLKLFKSSELDIFSRYSAGVNFNHHPEIPVFPYNSIRLGVRLYLNQNN